MKINYKKLKSPRKFFTNFKELVELLKNEEEHKQLIGGEYSVFAIEKSKKEPFMSYLHLDGRDTTQIKLIFTCISNDDLDQQFVINEENFEEMMQIINIHIIKDSDLIKFILDN